MWINRCIYFVESSFDPLRNSFSRKYLVRFFSIFVLIIEEIFTERLVRRNNACKAIVLIFYLILENSSMTSKLAETSPNWTLTTESDPKVRVGVYAYTVYDSSSQTILWYSFYFINPRYISWKNKLNYYYLKISGREWGSLKFFRYPNIITVSAHVTSLIILHLSILFIKTDRLQQSFFFNIRH